jgi:hypothetical protein
MQRPAIDFSAQMGDKESDAALLPHFQALKRAFAESGVALPCQHVERMAYVLRVSGSIVNFNFEGCERIDLNSRKKYISIDVGVPIARWKDRGDQEIAAYLAGAMREGLEQMLARLRAKKITCDEPAIRALFEQGVARYLATWSIPASSVR